MPSPVKQGGSGKQPKPRQIVIKTKTYIRDLIPLTLLRMRAAGGHFVDLLSINILVDLRISAHPYPYQYVRFVLRASSDDTQAELRTEPKMLEPTAQDNLLVSITRRDWLLQEKQQLQVSG